MSRKRRAAPRIPALSPRYWALRGGLSVLRAFTYLPYPVLLALGNAAGWLAYYLMPTRRRVAQINVRLCFPDLDGGEQVRLARRAFMSGAIAVFETGLAWWASDARLRKLVRYEGSENLARAREHGCGVFLLGGHYTTLELSGRLMCLFVDDINPIYKPAGNALFNMLMTRYRARIYDSLLINTEMRAMLRALREGKVIWYAPDQDFGRRRSVFAPFMGINAATLTMTSRLAQRARAPVLPYYSERLPGTQGYVIRVGPPLDNFPSGDDVADATAINRAIEVQVRRTPEQYLWGHRRFKTRPPGERKLY